MIKLNLASGTDIRDGWINMDIVEKWPNAERGCDIVWDARKDEIPFVDNSVYVIYAGYLFLHLAPHFHQAVLQEIYRVLIPGSQLLIGEVDMEIVLKKFLENPSDNRCHELIWGEQGNFHGNDLADFDKHCHGFTENTLSELLSQNGFINLQRAKIHGDEVFYELSILCNKG